MQTFLPYPNFPMCAKVLDDKRLGKQRVEAKQILNILEGKSKSKAWVNHPAVRMWRKNEHVLKHYINTMIKEWINRGFENNMEFEEVDPEILYSPRRLFDRKLHLSHRARLLKKNPKHYGQYWKAKDPNAPYWWPVPLKNSSKNKEMVDYWRARQEKEEKEKEKSKHAVH